jgi:hypothetical protein
MDLVALQKKVNAPVEEKDVAPVELGKKEEEVKKPNFAKRVETFTLTYIDDSDNEKKVQLHSKVMDYDARRKYDRVLAELSDGMVFDNLPIETRNRYICIARAVCQLVEPAEWVLNKIGEDIELCYSIGGKLLDHESRFFRYNSGENQSIESKPRFQLN